MSLSPKQIENYRLDGFLGPFKAFDVDEMSEIRNHIESNVLIYTPSNYPSNKHCRHLDDQKVFDICSHPSIIEKVSSIFGDDIILWRSHLFLKPAGSAEVPWHQDRDYWPLEPVVNISAWLAIDEATKKNSCVQVIPGSHKRIIPHIEVPKAKDTISEFEKMADPDELKKENPPVDMELKPGEFFIFNNLTLHRSAPNISQAPRMGIAVRLTIPIVKIYHKDIFKDHFAVLLKGKDRYGFNNTINKSEFRPQNDYN